MRSVILECSGADAPVADVGDDVPPVAEAVATAVKSQHFARRQIEDRKDSLREARSS